MARWMVILSAVAFLSSVGAQGAAYDFSDVGWLIQTPDPFSISIARDPGNQSTLVLELAKTFYYPRDEVTNVFPSLVLSFQQVRPDAQTASRIVIADEVIMNLTGSTWESFRWVLMSAGYASFNEELTNPVPLTTAQNPGWQISPFSQHDFSFRNDKAVELDVYGGQLASGQAWFPGLGNGSLVIDLDLSIDDDTFVNGQAAWALKEIPAPEPATLTMLMLGALAVLRRRAPGAS